jgi:hypothetical protein
VGVVIELLPYCKLISLTAFRRLPIIRERGVR